jgi:glucosamine 6-phosphate synthetase-like amidotransferase/phosphosugar isomerase protein
MGRRNHANVYPDRRLRSHRHDFLFLEDGEVVTVRPGSATLKNAAGATVKRAPQRIAWDPVQAEKGGYRHFMLKEIHEQPRAVRDSLLGRIGLEEGGVLATSSLPVPVSPDTSTLAWLGATRALSSSRR